MKMERRGHKEVMDFMGEQLDLMLAPNIFMISECVNAAQRVSAHSIFENFRVSDVLPMCRDSHANRKVKEGRFQI